VKTTDFMEFREVENESGTDAVIEVYVLGTLVQTIRNAWTRPGGWVYTEKEQCVQRVQRTIRLGWEQAGGHGEA
jgi:hypothetical protein